MSDSSCTVDTDEEFDGFLKKALDVNFPEDFNPNSLPKNGEEYLHHVIYERSQCEELVISNIDPSKYNRNRTYKVKVKDSVNTAVEHCKPSKEWQQRKLEDFLYMKQFLERHNTPKSTLITFDENEFIEKTKKESPSFTEFQMVSQAIKIRMIESIIRHLNSLEPGNSIDDDIGTWLFAILVMLDIPLSPSSCHSVRELARTCRGLRSHLAENADDKLYLPLNFYICICSRYFGQLDLSD